jgi:DNA modification methylase
MKSEDNTTFAATDGRSNDNNRTQNYPLLAATYPYMLIMGDSTKELCELPVTVNCVMTSPPYYRKRQYGPDGREIGHEKSPEQFVSSLVEVFNAVPLHEKGSIWVNLADTRQDGELLMIPEMFALRMQSEGWKLVDNVTWTKVHAQEDGTTEGGCMIEPAKRRLNGNGHESLFRFVRNTEAWTDTCAVRLPREGVEDIRYLPPELMTCHTSIEGRCLPNVWRIGMGQTKEKHYAVFPPELCERPIAMTCPMRICAQCGHLRTRITEDREYDEGRGTKRLIGKYSGEEASDSLRDAAGRMDVGRQYVPKKPVTIGWSDCGHNDWTSGVILDPFCGTGTTAEVALKMGRFFVGIDLYLKNLDITRRRCDEVLTERREKHLDPYKEEK